MNHHRPTRRQLLKLTATSAFAAPVFIPASALGRDGRPAPSERITMGCIGVRGMGNANMQRFLGFSDVQVIAVCDVDAEVLRERVAGVNQRYGNDDCADYRDFRDLMARDDIDAIMIGTPDHWHGLIGLAAVRAGKDVYCEKPITQTHDEGVALVKAVKENDCVWQTGSQQRSSFNFRAAAELVRNGHIGRLKHVDVGLPSGRQAPPHRRQEPPDHVDYDLWCGPAERIPFDPQRFHGNWRWHLNFGGGQLMDWINHHNDIAHWGMDMDQSGPVEVKATGEFPPEGRAWNAPHHYTVECVYADGVTTTISDSNNMGARFIGEDGWVYVDRGKFEASEAEWTKNGFDRGPIKLYESNDHQRNFVDCIKSRKQPICPPEVSLRSCTPGYLGYASMFTGRTIKWHPESQRVIGDDQAAEHLRFKPRGQWSLEA